MTYEGGQRRWLYPDVQGSIIALADGAGNVVAVNAYGPYGQPNQDQTGRFGLTGQAFIKGCRCTIFGRGPTRRASAASSRPTRSAPTAA